MKQLFLSFICCISVFLYVLPTQAEEKVLEQTDILKALPNDPEAGVYLEVAYVFKDLRVGQNIAEHQQRTLLQTKIGAAFYDTTTQKEIFGFDPLQEMIRIIDLAAPDKSPVPFGIAGFSSSTGVGAQLVMKVQTGFLERLQAAFKSQDPPAWKGKIVDNILRIEIDKITLIGKVDDQGWFRMAPQEEMLLGAGGHVPFEGTMQQQTQDADSLMFVRGGGLLASTLAKEIGNDIASQFMNSMRAAAISMRFDGDKSYSMSIHVDIPQFEQMAPVVRQPGLANSLAQIWDQDTTSFFSVSLPPALTAMAVPLAESHIQTSELKLPDAMMQALAQLDGRIGLVGFGSPGDWATAISFKDAKTAQNLVPALQEWIIQAFQEMEMDVNKSYILEPFEGLPGSVIHMRPDINIEGLRVASIGNVVVVVAQKSRLQALITRKTLQDTKKSDLPPVAGPLTPMLRNAIDTPAMMLGYSLMSTDGSFLDWLTWSFSNVKSLWRKAGMDIPQLAFVENILDRLPTLMKLGGIHMTLMYDMAITADLQGSVFSLQFLNSEI